MEKKGNIGVILYLLLLSCCLSNVGTRGVNGGMSCAVCTVLAGVAMQVAEVQKESLQNATIRLCNMLPDIAQDPCLKLASDIEPVLTDLSESITPDIFCLAYGTCSVDENQPLCHLFPLPFGSEYNVYKMVSELRRKKALKIDVCSLPVIKDICDILSNSYKTLDAAEDLDNDGFSIIETARGADWKGRDCADSNPLTYPGRIAAENDEEYDSNCNGIYGKDQTSNQSWEDLLCSRSQAKGLIYIGDSIGAHFHMPQVWINPIMFDWPGLNASDVILDEIDWPQYGFATGFRNVTPSVLIKGPTDSLYMRLRARNRCNHRDYQNLSQNGASSFEGISHAEAVVRNQTTDKPAVVIYAMQGNDVCNNFNNTIGNMTNPKTFKANVIKTLNILNKKLPKGSHVILVGLVNADFIYPAMAERIHPVGVLHNNVKYKDLYDWFNCMQIGPCAGWLIGNESLRNITTQKANELSNVLKELVKSQKYEYFDLHIVDNPINIIMREEKIYIPDFLEAVDSLHPNQKAQPLLAETLWSEIEKTLPPEVFGPTNPFNQKIKKLFGDQGGH